MIVATDPKAWYVDHKADVDDAIHRVLDSGWYILGEQVKSFEDMFAAYVGVHHAIGVASGTDAIELALRACGIGAGDVVLTVSHAAVATVAAIERCGATPALIDIDAVTYTLDPNLLTAAITGLRGAAKAVVPVHLYGHPADMLAIMQVAREHGLYVIEDCAQAHGAQIDDRQVGTWGDLAAYSFYPTKNLGALGDGGMVVTNDDSLAATTHALREYGWRERYVSAQPGINSRLDEMQAAVLNVRLPHLDQDNARRYRIAQQYDELLESTDLTLPTTRPQHTHAFHQYVIRTPQRDALRDFLRQHDVGTLIHYPVPVHEQPAYVGRLPNLSPLVHTEHAAREVLSLPMYPEIRDDDIVTVGNTIQQWSAANTAMRVAS